MPSVPSLPASTALSPPVTVTPMSSRLASGETTNTLEAPSALNVTSLPVPSKDTVLPLATTNAAGAPCTSAGWIVTGPEQLNT